jgi:hypothetical protein
LKSERAKAGWRVNQQGTRDDIAILALVSKPFPKSPNPDPDDADKAIAAQHDVVYWGDDLHLSGRKYVPRNVINVFFFLTNIQRKILTNQYYG